VVRLRGCTTEADYVLEKEALKFLTPPPALRILNQPTNVYLLTMPTSKPSVLLALLASTDLLFTSHFKETFRVDEPFSLTPSGPFNFKEVSLSRDQVVTVAKWLEESKRVKVLRERIKWLSSPKADGHQLWHKWVLKHVQPKLNTIIEAALTAKGIHPLTLAEQSTGWPSLSSYASNAYVPVGLELLGEDALAPNSTVVLKPGVGLVVPQLVSHTWARIRKAYGRKEVAMQKKKAVFKQQWAGKLNVFMTAV
jgi:hypothetical protein